MKKNFYILLTALLACWTPLSILASNDAPSVNIGTEKTVVTGCEGVTVVAGSGSIVISGLGSYSHIQVFTPDFSSQVFNREVTTATLTVPISTAGAYLVKVWSNPNPAAFCENNFPVTVGGGVGVSTLTLNGCNNASATAAAGATSAIVNYTMPTATTTCASGGATVTRTSGGASGTAFPVGTSQVCFSATDNCGNTKTCCITITVTGTVVGSTLTLNGCNNASATAAAGATSAIVNYTMPTASTTCATGGATVTRTSGGASGTAFPVGSSQVCFSATDNCGNTKTCCITITVTGSTGGGTCTEYTLGDANDCAGGSWQPYSLYVGTTTYRVKDGKFRKNSDGTATLTATYTSDGWSVVGSANVTFTGMTMTPPAGSPKFSPCTQGASATGWMYYTSFSGTVVLNGVSSTVTPRGEAFQVGVGANWQNAGDLGGSGWFTLSNGSLGDFNFRLSSPTNCGVVDPCLTDAVPPTFSGCPTTINLTTTGTCANASWTAPTATDNCGTPTVAQVAGGANGSCFAVGTTLVKYMATDAKGNTAICAFNVVVTQTVVDPCATDAVAPVFANCPATINLTTTGTCANASWTAPTATDNCGTPTVAQVAGGANGSCFAVGTTLVKYMATDAKGNTAICAFNVVVTRTVVDPCATDATPPVFANCPANIVKTPTAAGSCWTISWTAPTATDNCSTPTITQIAGPTNGSCLAPGSYGVTYRATDAKGNIVHCSFTITVNSYLNCNVVTGNTISKSCVNNVPSLNGSALSGYEYVWLSSTASCPSLTSQAISGATGQHYTLPSRVSVTTYFVRCARPIGCTTWGAINESNCITVYASDCAPTVCSPRATPAGWMYLGVFGTSHYFKYTTGDLNCVDSRSKAASIGGRLPVIKSAAQNAFIQSKLGGGSAWVGIRRSGNSWLWDNGAVASYYNWAYGEPNNYQNNEDCAQIRPDGTWNDITTHAFNWCIAEIPCAGVNVYLAANDQISMDASAELGRTRLSWVNNTGYKNDFFSVEKVNAVSGNFEKLELVNNKYTSDINEHYTVYDNTPDEGDNTYRVVVNYVDGTQKVSDVKTINFKGSAEIRLFPNPANDVVAVDLTKYKGLAVTISLYNQFGQQVLTRQLDKVTGEPVNVDVSQQQTGNYLMRVFAKGRKDAVKQLHISK
jgi:HYR domain/Lectin C-type domain/Secretion system C-terminal sorting domain